MTLADFERNLRNVLTLAVMAGHADPENLDELGGGAVMLLRELKDAGGLEGLVNPKPDVDRRVPRRTT